MGDDCPICLEKLGKTAIGVPNSCSHKFCFSCIRQWSKSANTCPLCKARFTRISPAPSSAAPNEGTGLASGKGKRAKKPRQPRAVSVRHRNFGGGDGGVPPAILQHAMQHLGQSGSFPRAQIGQGAPLGHIDRMMMRLIPQNGIVAAMMRSLGALPPQAQPPQAPAPIGHVSAASMHRAIQRAGASSAASLRAAAPRSHPPPTTSSLLLHEFPDEDDEEDGDWGALGSHSPRRHRAQAPRTRRSAAQPEDELIELDVDDEDDEELRLAREAEFDPLEVMDLLSDDDDVPTAAASGPRGEHNNENEDEEVDLMDSDSDEEPHPARQSPQAAPPPPASSSASSSSSSASASSSSAVLSAPRGVRMPSATSTSPTDTEATSSPSNAQAGANHSPPAAVAAEPAGAESPTATRPAASVLKRMRDALSPVQDGEEEQEEQEEAEAAIHQASPPRRSGHLKTTRRSTRWSAPDAAASSVASREAGDTTSEQPDTFTLDTAQSIVSLGASAHDGAANKGVQGSRGGSKRLRRARAAARAH